MLNREERLRAVIAANIGGSADEMIDAISGALAAFTRGAEQGDDVTYRRGLLLGIT